MYILLETFAFAVIFAPFFFLLWKMKFYSFRKTALCFIFSIYLSAIYILVGMPTVQFIRFDVNLNLIPFAGMIADLKNSMLNILLFVPLGFLLPLLWKKYRQMKNTLCFGLGTTVAIELLQLLTFRATDINDVITNFLGTVIGYLIFKAIGKTFKPCEKDSDVYWLVFIVAAIMFFIQPLVESLVCMVI